MLGAIKEVRANMKSGGDRIELMRLFIRIADTGSLSAGARLLGLSQPSASRQLKQLETILGVQLIWRSNAELALTDAGEQFIMTAKQLVADWDAATEAVGLDKEQLRGPIRIAAPVAAGQTVLSHIVTDFAVKYPGVSIDLRLTEAPGDLAAGGYDLWIKAGPIQDTSLIVRKLWRANRAIVARPDHPRVSHPKELEPYAAVQLLNYVSREMRLESEDAQTCTLRMKPTYATDNTFAALLAIKKGIGYGILPHWMIKRELCCGDLVDLCPKWWPPPVILSLAYPQTRFRPARVKAFLEFVHHELRRMGEQVLAEPDQNTLGIESLKQKLEA